MLVLVIQATSQVKRREEYTHSALAEEMAKIGDGLVLPGDSDWVNPTPGVEDWHVVKPRPIE